MKPGKFPAFCIAGTNSGCGKTTVALALMSALSRRGMRVAPFKCGPDYIDSSYHTAATGAQSVNLDTWMMGKEGVAESFARNCGDAEVAVIEGVMGLFDGAGASSLEGSTAECAATLGVPAILVVNASGTAGSIAALVHGFSSFAPNTNVCGVIASKVGSNSHAKLLSDALSTNKLPPLLGAIPRDDTIAIPERHLGLLPWSENKRQREFFGPLADIAEKHLDIEGILRISQIPRPSAVCFHYPEAKIKVAIARDEAFTFYYPDNIHHLRMAGFEFIDFSPLRDSKLPDNADMLYIGGGFPEIFAGQLAENCGIRNSIRDFALSALPVYAECGGLMYLGDTLRNSQGEVFPMCAVIPGKSRMTPGKRALGYREVETLHDLPFCKKGSMLRGHEFHWSEFTPDTNQEHLFKCKDTRGKTWRDGIRIGQISASYMHLHLGGR